MSSSGTPAAPPPKKARPGPLDSLGPYISHPESFPTTVVTHTPGFVAVRDLYPKSVVHLLLLPRDTAKTRLHPFEAFEDAEFLRAVRAEAAALTRLAAAELRRRFGDQGGRDWEREVKVGVHARPSMSHLHVHVISRDHHSERLKTAKHYSEFGGGGGRRVLAGG